MRQETEPELLKKIIGFQREEITSCIIYKKLATIEKDPENRKILQRISEDESRHYATLRSYTHREVTSNRWEIFFYVWLVRLLGITFAVRSWERKKQRVSIPSILIWNILLRWRKTNSIMKKNS